jgi:hypothetical protein
MKLDVLQDRPDLPVCGTYGKAVQNAASINFDVSGGSNCGDCPLKNTFCYAQDNEKRPDRATLLAKLRRHKAAGAAAVLERAISELWQRPFDLPWVRISTNGSVPIRPTRREAQLFRRLFAMLKSRRVPVHFPVEDIAKARRYRRIVGNLAVVRESVHTLARWVKTAGACSIVAGTSEMNRLERVAEAKRVAALRTKATGRKCIVCPAVAVRYLNGNKPSDKAKCGNCTACALAHVDVVYPLH